MIFTDTKIQGKKQEFKPLEKTMKKLGFDRWTWDLHQVTYDKKYTIADVDYYLRIAGKVINEKHLEHPKAMIQLEAPIFARHFFPHGLDNEAEIPEELTEEIKDKLSKVEQAF